MADYATVNDMEPESWRKLYGALKQKVLALARAKKFTGRLKVELEFNQGGPDFQSLNVVALDKW
jgi:hypothetical protein